MKTTTRTIYAVNYFAQEEQSRWQLKKGEAYNIYLKIGYRLKPKREAIVYDPAELAKKVK